MFSQTEIDRLIDAMRANGVITLEIKTDNDRLELRLADTAGTGMVERPPAPAPAPQMAAAQSPCIGRFAACGGDDGLATVTLGSDITAGQTLGYITQGEARAPIVAPVRGHLTTAPPTEGQIFGYGDSVFDLEVAP